MNEFPGCPLARGPAPGEELEAGKRDVETGRDDFEMSAGGEAGLEAAALTQPGKDSNRGKLGRTAGCRGDALM